MSNWYKRNLFLAVALHVWRYIKAKHHGKDEFCRRKAWHCLGEDALLLVASCVHEHDAPHRTIQEAVAGQGTCTSENKSLCQRVKSSRLSLENSPQLPLAAGLARSAQRDESSRSGSCLSLTLTRCLQIMCLHWSGFHALPGRALFTSQSRQGDGVWNPFLAVAACHVSARGERDRQLEVLGVRNVRTRG